jgi:hypothetical protein
MAKLPFRKSQIQISVSDAYLPLLAREKALSIMDLSKLQTTNQFVPVVSEMSKVAITLLPHKGLAPTIKAVYRWRGRMLCSTRGISCGFMQRVSYFLQNAYTLILFQSAASLRDLLSLSIPSRLFNGQLPNLQSPVPSHLLLYNSLSNGSIILYKQDDPNVSPVELFSPRDDSLPLI